MSLLPEIRRGQISDCTDLLTVYQTTRPRETVPKTVEDVKRQHRSIMFCKWGWLVAIEGSHVIGEITFRPTESPSLGPVGVITSLDVDARFQHRSVGRSLVSAAEEVMRERHIKSIHVDSPPSAYNYWMRLNYFSKDRLLRLVTETGHVRFRKRTGMEILSVSRSNDIPPTLHYFNITHPGYLLNIAEQVLDGGLSGAVFEYKMDGVPIGASALSITSSDRPAHIVADFTVSGEAYYGDILRHIIREARQLGSTKACTLVSTEQLHRVDTITKWSTEEADIIPMMRIL